MDGYRRIRCMSIILTLIATTVVCYEQYLLWPCLEMTDKFIFYETVDNVNSVCKFLGKPMAKVITVYHVLDIFCILLFLVGVFKGHWSFLLAWLGIHCTFIANILTFSVTSHNKLLLILFAVVNLILWFVGLYVFLFMSRFNRKNSFV